MRRTPSSSSSVRDATPVAEICRKAGISQATYFNWKKKYWLVPSEVGECGSSICWTHVV